MPIQPHISSRHTLPDERRCIICNEPVRLQRANTDENGKIVHEQCYVDKVKSKFRTTQPHRPPSL